MIEDTITTQPFCLLLERDPDLAEAIPPVRRVLATQQCQVRELTIPIGRWKATHTMSGETGVGLLLLDGLLIRRTGIDGRFGAELLGEGDLLRPWQEAYEPPMLPVKTAWRVLEPSTVAVLDEGFLRHIADHPELSTRLIARAVNRARNLAINMAIVHHARVDVRLRMLFWHFASRWGRVRTNEVWLPLRLTHAVLAEIAAARRPTVTSALTDLARRGLVIPEDGGWLLCGEPPGELAELMLIGAELTRERARSRAW